MHKRKKADDIVMTTVFGGMRVKPTRIAILRDFRKAPLYIHCFFPQF